MNDEAGAQTIWYLAQLKPNGEQLAERNLLRQGYGVFSPKVRRTRRERGKFREELAALFPGYLFVSVCARLARWRAIGSTLGVQRVVGFGGAVPSRVSGELIAGLMRRCETAAGAQAAGALKPGDAVRIRSGPLADFLGEIERTPSERRIWVLLDLLGRKVALHPDQVEPHRH